MPKGASFSTTSTSSIHPTAGFHEYRFVYAPDSVSFYVDGRHMKTRNDGISQTSMHLMANTWFPVWLEGRKPKKTVYTYGDRIDYVEQSSDATVVSNALTTNDAAVASDKKGAEKELASSAVVALAKGLLTVRSHPGRRRGVSLPS